MSSLVIGRPAYFSAVRQRKTVKTYAATLPHRVYVPFSDVRAVLGAAVLLRPLPWR